MTRVEAEITEEQVEQFQRDGAIRIRGAFDDFWIDVLARGVEKNLEDPSPYGCRYTKEGEPGAFLDDYCNWQRIDEYRSFALESGAGAMVGRLLRSTEVRFFHEHVLVKEPGTRDVSPWHQDQPYYCVDGEKVASVWLPLDPVDEDVCPEFVAGSHRWGRLFAPRKFVDHAPYPSALDAFERTPDIDSDRSSYDVLSWKLEIGDCIVFHMRTVHGAPGTAASKTRRRAFATRWLGDDAVFATRPFETSPPFPNLTLSPGEPMNDPLFPVVYQEVSERR